MSNRDSLREYYLGKQKEENIDKACFTHFPKLKKFLDYVRAVAFLRSRIKVFQVSF